MQDITISFQEREVGEATRDVFEVAYDVYIGRRMLGSFYKLTDGMYTGTALAGNTYCGPAPCVADILRDTFKGNNLYVEAEMGNLMMVGDVE